MLCLIEFHLVGTMMQSVLVKSCVYITANLIKICQFSNLLESPCLYFMCTANDSTLQNLNYMCRLEPCWLSVYVRYTREGHETNVIQCIYTCRYQTLKQFLVTAFTDGIIQWSHHSLPRWIRILISYSIHISSWIEGIQWKNVAHFTHCKEVQAGSSDCF